MSVRSVIRVSVVLWKSHFQLFFLYGWGTIDYGLKLGTHEMAEVRNLNDGEKCVICQKFYISAGKTSTERQLERQSSKHQLKQII